MSLKNFVLAALATGAMAHMKMRSPKPFAGSVTDNSPLLADGSNYPCKMPSGGYEDAEAAAANVYALGASAPLAFTGSAVHGGGSCQIALTTDKNPTKDSVFRVIHSFIGGCPARNINDNYPANSADFLTPDEYSFAIPDDIPAGDYVLAWVWHNRIGNREMYMNCAPVTLTGDSAAGAEDTFASLPEIQKFNIEPFKSSCYTDFLSDENDLAWDLLYPEPGRSVEFLNHTMAGFERNGAKCVYTGSSGSGSGSGDSSAPASSVASPSATMSAPASSAPAATKTATATVPAGGVFITADPDASSSAAATTTSAPAATPTPTTGSGSGSGSGSNTGSGSGSGSSSGSGSGYSSGAACTTEGNWNCVGGTQFQQCASGMWSALQAVAAGTTCSPGESATLSLTATRKKGKRAVGFRA